jgi:hypothetical protein
MHVALRRFAERCVALEQKVQEEGAEKAQTNGASGAGGDEGEGENGHVAGSGDGDHEMEGVAEVKETGMQLMVHYNMFIY